MRQDLEDLLDVEAGGAGAHLSFLGHRRAASPSRGASASGDCAGKPATVAPLGYIPDDAALRADAGTRADFHVILDARLSADEHARPRCATEPANPACAATRVPAPISTLCPTCTCASSFAPAPNARWTESARVDAARARRSRRRPRRRRRRAGARARARPAGPVTKPNPGRPMTARGPTHHPAPQAHSAVDDRVRSDHGALAHASSGKHHSAGTDPHIRCELGAALHARARRAE